jgi:hypothetical protein
MELIDLLLFWILFLSTLGILHVHLKLFASSEFCDFFTLNELKQIHLLMCKLLVCMFLLFVSLQSAVRPIKLFQRCYGFTLGSFSVRILQYWPDQKTPESFQVFLILCKLVTLWYNTFKLPPTALPQFFSPMCSGYCKPLTSLDAKYLSLLVLLPP